VRLLRVEVERDTVQTHARDKISQWNIACYNLINKINIH
jgi:hypothetical protein